MGQKQNAGCEHASFYVPYAFEKRPIAKPGSGQTHHRRKDDDVVPSCLHFCFTGSRIGRWRGSRVTGWMCSTSTRGILSSRSRCRRCSWRRWSPHRASQGQVRRNAFLLASPPPFCLNFRNSLERLWENDDLPRQARDKRKENFKTRGRWAACSA